MYNLYFLTNKISTAFTKSLAEALVVEARNKHKLPALIFRPSIILATWRDPIPGYVDNFNGPSKYQLIPKAV